MTKSNWFIGFLFLLIIICGFLSGITGYARTGLILFGIALVTYYGGKAWRIVKEEEKRKRVEEALQEEQRRLAEIIDFFPDATLVIDKTGKVIAWNRAIEQMTGVKAEEMIGKGNYEYAIPFYGERRPILIDLALLSDDEFLTGHYDDIHRQDAILSGEVFVPKTYGGKGAYLWATASRLFNADGKIIGAIESIRDITERKLLDKALRESEGKYRELVENANSIILRMDTQGNVTFFNDYASRFFGFSHDDIIGRNVIGTIVPRTDSAGKDLTEMILDIGVHPELYKNNENENICRNGARVLVAWTNTPILDDQGRCVELLCIGNDVTERKLAEEEMRKANMVVENSPVVLFRCKAAPGWPVELVSKNVVQFGYTPEEFLTGKLTYSSIVHPEDLERLIAETDEFSATGKGLWFQEYRIVTKYGHIRWIIDETVPERNEEGEITHYEGVIIDVTERRKAEEALQKSEERLKSILHGSPVPQFVIDGNHKIIYWNKALEEFTGYRSEEMVGTCDLWKAFYPDNQPTLADLLIDRKTEELDAWYSGKWSRSKILDDAYEVTNYFPGLGDCGKWLHFTATLVHDSKGAVLGAVETLQDITERKRAKDRLQEQLHFLQELIDDIPAPVLFRNFSGQYLGCNKAFEEFLGVEKKDIVGKSVYDVHPKEMADFCLASDRDLLDSPKITQVTDATLQDVSGVSKEILFYKAVYTMTDGSVGGIVGTFIDITERKRLEQEVLKSQKLESLGLLAGGLAHDFNNILTGIIGNISMAKLQLDPSHIIVKRLELCEKAAMRAADLTRQLLTFARGGEPVKKLINPASLIRETVPFALRGSTIRSSIDIQDGLWCMEVDESQLSQVLNNLLINAVQAMPAGGEVTVRAVNETLFHDTGHHLPPGDYIRISVEDCGCGIPQENLLRIFDPYYTTKTTGSGLGLASVYSIVKRHGGAVEVTSAQGTGSTFTVLLPAIPGGCPEDEGTKVSAELKGSGRVLIMDDEETIREIAAYTLEFLGFEVESCADGRQAVERFRAARNSNDPFSAVILDLTIPGGMGGREAAARILEIDPDAVLIVSSGYSSDPVVANFRQYGFSGVVPKPFDAEGLAKELNRLIPIITSPSF